MDISIQRRYVLKVEGRNTEASASTQAGIPWCCVTGSHGLVGFIRHLLWLNSGCILGKTGRICENAGSVLSIHPPDGQRFLRFPRRLRYMVNLDNPPSPRTSHDTRDPNGRRGSIFRRVCWRQVGSCYRHI